MFEEDFSGYLTVGLHCMACNKPLTSKDIDPELCGECMVVVMDYNKDLTELENEPPTEAVPH